MMRRAIALAEAAGSGGEVPVAAVVYRGDEILAEAANDREATSDPLGHAELRALSAAGRATGTWRLDDCTMAVTLEPCPMCAAACVNARLGRLIYGALDPKAGACRSLYTIPTDPRLNHRVTVIGEVLAEECAAVLRRFFEARRVRASPAGRGPLRPIGSAPPAVRLVCFDIGGVVIRICRSWAEGCAAAGIAVRAPSLWQDASEARHSLVVEYQTGRIDGATFAERTSALAGGLYSPAEIQGIHNSWLLGEYEGVADLIDRLHRAKIDTAALSNTNHAHWTRMGDYPAVARIRHHLPSHRLGLHKPDPAFYLRLEQLLGYCGQEILFFDDTPENVRAAIQIGWRAERIDPLEATAPQIRSALQSHGVDFRSS